MSAEFLWVGPFKHVLLISEGHCSQRFNGSHTRTAAGHVQGCHQCATRRVELALLLAAWERVKGRSRTHLEPQNDQTMSVALKQQIASLFCIDLTQLTEEAYKARIWFLYKVLSNARGDLNYFASHPFKQPARFSCELSDFNNTWRPNWDHLYQSYQVNGGIPFFFSSTAAFTLAPTPDRWKSVPLPP